MNKQDILSELKDGMIDIDDVINANDQEQIISDEDQRWILDKYKKTLENRMENRGDIKQEEDPINKQREMRTWGTPESDQKFTHIEDNHFTVFAGSGGTGKTAFSFFVANKNAETMKVLYLSLEMTKRSLLSRFCMSYAGITKEQWRSRIDGAIGNSQKSAYFKKMREISENKNLILEGIPTGEPASLENIFIIIDIYNPKLIVIDNLGLIESEGKNEIEKFDIVTRNIMNWTNENNLPIILIHHLNKSGTIRGTEKIRDHADAVFTCKRAEGELAIDKAKFIVKEDKDRVFGNGGIHTFYFKKGSFYDYFDEYSEMDKQIFNP